MHKLGTTVKIVRVTKTNVLTGMWPNLGRRAKSTGL